MSETENEFSTDESIGIRMTHRLDTVHDMFIVVARIPSVKLGISYPYEHLRRDDISLVKSLTDTLLDSVRNEIETCMAETVTEIRWEVDIERDRDE